MSIEIDFSSLREDAALEVEELLGRVSAQMERSVLVKHVRQLCLDLHTIGVATLLRDGEPQFFFLNLCRAGENWRRLLLFHDSKKWMPLAASQNTPLLGVMAAGQWNLARQIAERSSTQWQEGEEYEDDFAWAIVLQHLASGELGSSTQLEKSLTRLEAVGGELHASRLFLIRSLLASDAHGFSESFRDLLRAHEEQIEKRTRTFGTPVERFAPYRYIWFEGLALLRLGERAGLPVDGYYTYCPPLARLPMTERYEGDWAISLA
ncbi:hypothetical protein [Archangium minus]